MAAAVSIGSGGGVEGGGVLGAWSVGSVEFGERGVLGAWSDGWDALR